MDITFNCDKCGHPIQIDEACAGLVMKCVKCCASVVIPSPMAHLAPDPEEISVPLSSEAAPRCRRSVVLGATAVAVLVLVVLGLSAIRLMPRGHKPTSAPPVPSFVTKLPAPAPPLPPAEPVVENPRNRFLRTARSVLGEIKKLHGTFETNISLDQYTEQVGEIAERIDGLLAAAEETGMYGEDSNARELCVTATALFFDYKQVLNQWSLEDLLMAQLAEYESAEAQESGATDALKDKRATISAKVETARKARAELWAHAKELVAKLEMTSAKLGEWNAQSAAAVPSDAKPQ